MVLVFRHSVKTALSESNPYLKICLDEYSHLQMFIFPLAFSLMRYLSKTASEVERYSARIKGGKFIKKQRYCVGWESYQRIWCHQLD